MKLRQDVDYVKSHEWVKDLGDDVVEIGITDFAQDALGDIVFINLPDVGDEVTIGESFGDIESVKAVSDVFSPVTGIVAEINEALLDDPAKINEDAYDAWLIRIKDVTQQEKYLTAKEYEVLAGQEA